MQLDANTCYRALESRDRRFDGRFFTAVRTTGIYCRPICPARTPARANVDFYPSAAAAESAGFRACRRCRPDAAPGTPEWSGTSAVVSRALRLIRSGALNLGSLPELAGRLGIGERHLTRLFVEQLGTTPGAVARTQRAHFARRLIDQTRLPMTEVALLAGYQSVRRFNDAIRESFAFSPSELRRAAGKRANAAAEVEGPSIRLALAYRPPYDWEGILAYLAGRAIPGREEVRDGSYRRLIQRPSAEGTTEAGTCRIEVRHLAEACCLELEVFPATTPGLSELVADTRRVFDLDADPGAIGEVLSADTRLAPLVKDCPGQRVPGAYDPFELAIRAIIGQQVSVKGATTIAGRLVERFGESAVPAQVAAGAETDAEAGGEPSRLFPRPEVLATSRLQRASMPQARADAIRVLAGAVADGAVRLGHGEDPEAARQAMLDLPGIGPWTADYVLMRGMSQPDAFPSADLGLREAIARLDGTSRPTARALERLSEAWRPWRSYAAQHLWRSL
ncbi:hypothetical protein ABI59_11050 [Acidobacteria bacterium Mor1]|nr:hypothetical protein ABI59_11050 [Acidobacteria bacterium Mor1]